MFPITKTNTKVLRYNLEYHGDNTMNVEIRKYENEGWIVKDVQLSSNYCIVVITKTTRVDDN